MEILSCANEPVDDNPMKMLTNTAINIRAIPARLVSIFGFREN
jgi:hypothetical protein